MIGIIIILIPLIIYVIGAFSVKKKKLQHPDDFFVAYKRVGETAFSSSSISYAFQVSTIYPFLLWGASEFYFIPLVNTICWGIGILLFYLSYNRYKKFIGKDVTLHGFLGETYGKYVRVVASYLTIVAFLGFTISETYFGSKVLLSIIDSKTVFYFVIIISIFFVYSYISYGGQVSSLRTDQLQLIISYIGVFGLVLYLTYLIFKNDIKISPVLSIGLLVFSLYALAILFFRKFEFIKLNEKDNKSDIFINKLLNTLVVLFFIAISTTSLYVFFVSESKIIISKNTLFNIDGFGYSGLLSLIILPLCFQFVDLSNWQRLLSVKDDNKNSINIVNNKIRKGLLNYALESPFTWLIFVFFGILVVTSLPHFTFQDLLIDIPKNLIKSDLLIEKILGYSFIVSILAIMLSTIDSFLMGIIFTYTYDSNPKTRKILDSKDNQLIIKNNNLIIKKGRIFGFILISVGLLFFILLDKNIKNGGELFINLLLSFYSAQISFFPLVFSILFLKKRPSAFWAISSMIVSSLIGISVGIYAVIINPEWAWFPILLCFVISNLIFFTGYFLTKNKNKYNEI